MPALVAPDTSTIPSVHGLRGAASRANGAWGACLGQVSLCYIGRTFFINQPIRAEPSRGGRLQASWLRQVES